MANLDVAVADDQGRRTGDADRRLRSWLELLALLAVVAAVGAVLGALLEATAWVRASTDLVGAPEGGSFEWGQWLGIAALGGSVGNGLLVATALALVALAPGARAGRLGVVVVNAVSVVGVAVAALALLGVEESLRRSSSTLLPGGQGGDATATWLARLGVVAEGLPAAALAGGAAYLAWRLLTDGNGSLVGGSSWEDEAPDEPAADWSRAPAAPAAPGGPVAPVAPGGPGGPVGPADLGGTPAEDSAWSRPHPDPDPGPVR